jgi:hypothetical protein
MLRERGPGRRRISWLMNLRAWFSKTSAELLARMIANIRNEYPHEEEELLIKKLSYVFKYL